MAASKLTAGAWLCAALLTLAAPFAAHAAPAGAVEYTQGVATVQGGAQTHIAGPGAQVNQGDTITTAPGSYTVVKLSDGTRMTIRPDSKMVITTYDYQPNQANGGGSMVFSLLRGGLRAITGLIPKRDVNAARIITPTATVGIRGTDFDARLCNGDCGTGTLVGDTRVQHPNNIVASARVLSETGVTYAINAQGNRRLMATGAPVYPGDTIETPVGINAVLVFRDETRMTVQPNTRMKVDDFVFDAKQPTEGRFFVSLIKGGLRAFTGVIGRANHDNVAVRTPTATVGIRGTGYDLQCVGSCANEAPGSDGDGLTATVWDGVIVLRAPDGAELLVLNSGETGFINRTTPAIKIDRALNFDTPRPDQVTVDMALLFGETDLSDNRDGLYVLVRDGHVSLELGTGELDLGQGETGFTDGVVLIRPIITPTILQYDPIPLPGGKYGDLLSLINSQGVPAQCSR